METIEIWKKVEGFEESYMISNLGRVKSCFRILRTKKVLYEKIMKLRVHTNGYQVVWLKKPGKNSKFFIHRLVAIHFFEKVEGKEFVNHKDKNRLNNHHANLEWVTHQENIKHRDNKQHHG